MKCRACCCVRPVTPCPPTSIHRPPLSAARERTYDLVIIDYELPGMNGEQFMHEVRKIQPAIAVVFVSGSLTIELAIKLSSQGVAGIFNKPANPKTLLEKINETLSRTGSRDAALPGKGSISPLPAARRGNSNSPFRTAPLVALTPTEGELAYQPKYFLGASEPFVNFTHRLWKVRDFRAVLLLQGERGSPFELLARDLAEISMFRDGPMMVCSAAQFATHRLIEVLAPTLLSHDAGTLVITGIETFTPAQQIILGNLMSGRDVFLPFARRFRLVLATAANLADLVETGGFDETLFYKISSLSLSVPALREVRGDILANARQILAEYRAATNAPAPFDLTPAAAALLEAQDWPGNYGHLSRLLHATAGHSNGAAIDVPALEARVRASERELIHHEPGPAPTVEPAAIAAPAESSVPLPRSTAVATEISTPISPALPASPTPVAARSVFRPTSSSYNFIQRLARSLAAADVGTAA